MLYPFLVALDTREVGSEGEQCRVLSAAVELGTSCLPGDGRHNFWVQDRDVVDFESVVVVSHPCRHNDLEYVESAPRFNFGERNEDRALALFLYPTRPEVEPPSTWRYRAVCDKIGGGVGCDVPPLRL